MLLMGVDVWRGERFKASLTPSQMRIYNTEPDFPPGLALSCMEFSYSLDGYGADFGKPGEGEQVKGEQGATSWSAGDSFFWREEFIGLIFPIPMFRIGLGL